MSLGFNQNRKHRVSTLPGAVNATAVRETRRSTTTAAASVLFPTVPSSAAPRRRSPPAAILGSKRPTATTLPALAPEVVAPAPAPPAVAPPTPVRLETPPRSASEEMHAVYASVTEEGLVAVEGGDVVASHGERVVLVYPMRSEGDDGVVTMRRKSVHPVTGQLSYDWVRVYDPNSETRYVTDFSLLP